MGLFCITTSKDPSDLCQCIKGNIDLYIEAIDKGDSERSKYLLEFAKRQIEELESFDD